jgi:hypothetical protein
MWGFEEDADLFRYADELLDPWEAKHTHITRPSTPFSPINSEEPDIADTPATSPVVPDRQVCQEIPSMTGPGGITAAARAEMNAWVVDHIQNPFLTKEDEDYFMVKFSLARRQVKTAFNNRRQRIVAPARAAVQKQLQEQFIGQLAALGMALSIPGYSIQIRPQ